MVLDKTMQSRRITAPKRGHAKRMRREPTEAEKLFWWEVRDRRLDGHKQSHGSHVMRVWNAEIFTNMEGVIDAALAELERGSLSPSP